MSSIYDDNNLLGFDASFLSEVHQIPCDFEEEAGR